MTNTSIDIAALEALENAATPGPWGEQPVETSGMEIGASFIIADNCGGLVGAALAWPSEIDEGRFSRVERNAAFIVALRNDAPELIKAVKERDEWERKYNAIVMGADPKASGTAKTYWAAVERACDEALTRYKHEAREAQSAVVSLRALLAEAGEALAKVLGELRTVDNLEAYKAAKTATATIASIQSALRDASPTIGKPK